MYLHSASGRNVRRRQNTTINSATGHVQQPFTLEGAPTRVCQRLADDRIGQALGASELIFRFSLTAGKR